MRVKIEEAPKEELFVPYKVTFFIQTPAEATRFHDRVACKITDGSHAFIGDVFRRGRGGTGLPQGDSEFNI